MATAYCLRGEGFFYDVYDEPERTKEFRDLVVDSVLDFKRFIADLNERPHMSPSHKLYDDVGSMLSCDMWPEFVLP